MRLIDILSPVNFIDINSYDVYEKEFIIVGSGIAGLRAALEISKTNKVTVITKSEIIETNTQYAQGGIAVVLAKEDNFELHIEDTLYAGDGICDRKSVEVLVKEGPDRIKELLEIDTRFDRHEDGKLSMTKEAAHSKRRILHAGDTTGAEIERALTKEVLNNKNIEIDDYSFFVDFIDDHSIILYNIKEKKYKIYYFKGIIMAMGSIGQIYENTSNPAVATGDGLAIAYRNGLELSDMEFVQFHPTIFYKEGVPRFLISESLRGEGGILKNKYGEKFMHRYHPDAELAPRDVVSRSILREMENTNSKCVYLDMTHLEKDYLYKRFPNISAFCLDYDIDIAINYIPVSPAAHYMMGGITTSIDGKTSKSNVYAAGEVSRTGVHGANRLASNSLLEGLVFGKRAGETAVKESKDIIIDLKKIDFRKNNKNYISEKELNDLIKEFKKIMWEKVGILRDEHGLNYACKKIDKIIHDLQKYKFDEKLMLKGIEFLNMITVGYIITESSLARKESRGAHFRLDYPEKKENQKLIHYTIKK